MAEFKNYDLGAGGVNVDASPVHISTEELLKAQNAIRDPLGVVGGLKNRPGLVKFSAAGAGSILGGMGIPLVGFDLQRIYVAQQDGTVEKWYSSTDLFTSNTAETGIAAWQDPTEYFSTAAGVSRMGALYQKQLYYAAAGYTVGTGFPPIRVYNGSDDRQISQLAETVKGVVSMVVTKGALFILSIDSGTTDANWVGHVHSMDEQGRLTQIGTAIATGYVPISLTILNGLIFVGTARLTTTNEARIYRINPLTETTWSLEFQCAADDYMVTDLESFQGRLYATTKNGGAGTKGKILQRGTDGVWTTVDSTVNNTGTYESLASFNNFLYASSRSYSTTTNTAVIRRSADGTTWATVYNSSSTDGVGILTVIGLRLFSMFSTKFLHTTSGTSYTSVTLPGANAVDGVIGPLTARGDAQFFDPVTGANADEDAQSTGVTVTIINPPGAAGSGLLIAEGTLTMAELTAMGVTPLVIVVGVSGKIIVPVRFSFVQRGGTAINTSPAIGMNYTGDGVALMSTVSVSTTASRYIYFARGVTTNLQLTNDFEPDGIGIEISHSSILTGGVGATFRWALSYYFEEELT